MVMMKNERQQSEVKMLWRTARRLLSSGLSCSAGHCESACISCDDTKSLKNADGITDYLMAIAYKRMNNGSQANSFLQKAIQKDPTLADYAAKDLEFK